MMSISFLQLFVGCGETCLMRALFLFIHSLEPRNLLEHHVANLGVAEDWGSLERLELPLIRAHAQRRERE